jgi:hypothetical protein
MSDSKIKRATEIQDSIRQILFREWDPIGVNDKPNLVDEYDSCIASVYRILAGSRSEDELIDYLCKTAFDIVGQSGDAHEQFSPVAKKLLALDVKL